MKVKKFFGILFTCLGCIAAFIGLAATVLPMIQNDQLGLVLSSFEMPSDRFLVSLMNTVMTYALRHCYLVLLCGIGILLLGVLLICVSHEDRRKSGSFQDGRSAAPGPYTARAPSRVSVPQWHSSKAAEVKPGNPFAEAAPADLFAPKAAPKAAEEYASYAKPVRPIVDTAYAPPREENPYQRAMSARVNPYARPEGEQPTPQPEAAASYAPVSGQVKAEEAAPLPGAFSTQAPYTVAAVQPTPAESLATAALPIQTPPRQPDIALPTAAPAFLTTPLAGSAVQGSVAANQQQPAVPSASPAAPLPYTAAPIASAAVSSASPVAPLPYTAAPAAPVTAPTAPTTSAPAAPTAAPSTLAIPPLSSTVAPSAPAKPRVTMSGFAPKAPEPVLGAAPNPSALAPQQSKKGVRIKSTMGKHS